MDSQSYLPTESLYIDVLRDQVTNHLSIRDLYPDFYQSDMEHKMMSIHEQNSAKLYLSFKRTSEKIELEFINALEMNRIDYASAFIYELAGSRISENVMILRCIAYYKTKMFGIYKQ